MTVTFDDLIHEVVSDFLETALVVDDEAQLPTPTATATTGTRADSSTAAGANDAEALDTAEDRDDETAATSDETVARARGDLSLETPSEHALAEAEHPLLAKPLIDAFADSGILCSVLALVEGDPIQDRFVRAASRADLLIVDWELYRDGGDTARKLISAVVETDAAAERKRLRVIAIYTGQPGLADIVEQIREHLEFAPDAVRDDGLTLVQGNVRVTAFSKPLAERHLRQELREREIPEDQLPARLVREFACLTRGLVPAVALASLAAIRNDTHRILQALGPELDIGYLGHRVALPFPEDAEGHLVDMIVAEIGSVVGENDVGRRANQSVISAWLAAQCAGEDPLVCGSALPFDAEFDIPAMEKLVALGLGLDETLKEHEGRGVGERTLKRVRKQAAHLFARAATEAEASADLLAARLAVRTVYSHPTRRLRLGTIVCRDGRYLMCVQPRCDSVRLPPGETRGFPFLPLKVVAGNPETARDLVIYDVLGGSSVSLRLTTKPYMLSIHEFLGGEQRFVEAALSDGEWRFHDAHGDVFRWVAELKPEFAQRVAVDFAAEAVRVGLAESELVRLSRPAT